MSSIEQLAANFSLAQKKSDASVRPEISPPTGKFRTVALRQLMTQNGLGGKRWVGQAPLGFPNAGSLSLFLDLSLSRPLSRSL